MRKFKIARKKGDTCPICYKKLSGKNYWVKYHISYKPELCILACRYCNYTEWAIRNSIRVGKSVNPERVTRVIAYQLKFGIIL